ncbi:hypothetical protein [Methanooceanicella nereidis]|uniref:hypothetical protein n=1 Tax=Methanooceanicella nereidis TaxID=2052831 RepID=UPI001E3EF18F|nr:hypothetical protein [Methanocella sp. CWC-04]
MIGESVLAQATGICNRFLGRDYEKAYIRQVEQEFRDNADEVLKKLDLSYLQVTQ